MRKYILYMVGLVLSVATVGCVKSDGTSANQSGMVTLQLSNGTLTTRAVAPGPNDDTNNEDLIVDAQVFFFGSNADNATVQYSYYTDITDVNETASISIPLSTEQLSSLFPSGTGYVYVIANYGSELATTGATLASLKATAITSAFNAEGDGKQASFIMDSDLTTVARGTANTITGEVFLTRAAAKVELTVNVAPIEQDGKQWIADTANMRLSFNNGVSDGVIDDGSDEEGAEPANGDTTFDIDGRGFTLVSGAAGNGSFVQSVPFYSYSTKWAAGAENEVYLELAIPWAVNTEGDTDPTYQTFYYQVPVSADALTLVRNAYYKLTLDVGVLGGLTEPVTVEPSYVVLDWGTNDVNVTLSRPKYLVVDENYVVVNNLEDFTIGYQSSDAVSFSILDNTYETFYNGNRETWDAVINDMEITVENGVITFHHSLDNTREQAANDPATRYDYLANTVKIRIYHTNDSSIYEDVTIIQYPAMYLTSDNGNLSANNYVIINTNRDYNNGGANSGDVLQWETVGTTSTGFVTQYTVNVNAFDASTANYLITDPRVPSNTVSITQFPSYRTNGGSTIAAGNIEPDATGDNNLSGYRRTITGDAANNLVAPSFIIASAAGTYINGDSYINAETSGYYRCASYQENGYPAGRWRIPTPAELNVVGRLCAEGKITETVFKNTVVYMSSNGPYRYNETDGTFTQVTTQSHSGSIRCVYDAWYWKDKCADPSQFIWGAEGDIANGAKSDYLVPVE